MPWGRVLVPKRAQANGKESIEGGSAREPPPAHQRALFPLLVPCVKILKSGLVAKMSRHNENNTTLCPPPKSFWLKDARLEARSKAEPRSRGVFLQNLIDFVHGLLVKCLQAVTKVHSAHYLQHFRQLRLVGLSACYLSKKEN